MKFSIGDKILMKRTGEEGHVVAYISDQMVEVEVGGTTFPVHLEEVDHPYLKWFTDKNKQQKKATPPEQLPVEKQSLRKQRLAKGVYLSFLPVFKADDFEDIVDNIKIYLLNELAQPVKFSYDVRFGHESEFKHEGTLHAFGDVYLHHVAYGDMNDQPRFHWQLTDTINKDNGVEEGILRIRPNRLFEHINEGLQKNEPTFSYLLIDDFKPKKKEEPKEKFEPFVRPNFITSRTTSKLDAAKDVIDLHIEELVDTTSGLTNAEIIKIQLDTLERYLQLAIVHRLQRMVVIHGLGKGTLREEVHRILKQTGGVKRYKNEWSGSYGFGATEVTFKL